MKDITLPQLSQLYTLIKQKQLSSTHFNHLLSTGLLADLFDKSVKPSEIKRESFREVIGFGKPHIIDAGKFEVNYDIPFSEAFKKSNPLCPIYYKILSKQFYDRWTNSKLEGKHTVGLFLVKFSNYESITREAADNELEKNGFRSATPHEILSFSVYNESKIENNVYSPFIGWEGKSIFLVPVDYGFSIDLNSSESLRIDDLCLAVKI